MPDKDHSLLGREYYTVDPKTVYTVRGIVVGGTVLIVGEYRDPNDNKVTRLATHKLTEVKLSDSAPPVP